jgi:hypothetical protein
MVLLILICLWFAQGQVSAAENQNGANAQQSAQSPSPVIERANAGQAGNSGQNNRENSSRWSDPLVWLNFALFVAVLIQAGIYWKQLTEMRKTLSVLTRQADTQEQQSGTMQGQLTTMNQQADVMRRQLEAMAISERAYLTIENLTINPITTNVLTIKAVIVNAGRTPAFEFRTKTQAAVFPKGNPPPVDWDACAEDEAPSFIPANASRKVDFASIPNITQQTVDALNSGIAQLFIDAQCTYLDFTRSKQVLVLGYTFEVREDETYRAILRYQNHYTDENPPEEKEN